MELGTEPAVTTLTNRGAWDHFPISFFSFFFTPSPIVGMLYISVHGVPGSRYQENALIPSHSCYLLCSAAQA